MNAQFFSGPLRVATALALGSAIAPGVSEAGSTDRLARFLSVPFAIIPVLPRWARSFSLSIDHDRPIETVLTNSTGEFGLQGLPAGHLFDSRFTDQLHARVE